ncbi:MAG: PQQ-binding-like beta-propeller repeat protein [Caulobacterales bacterium]
MRIGAYVAIAALAGAAGLIVPMALGAQTPAAPSDGEALFNAKCASCHDAAVRRAPNRAALAVMPAADIVQALTTGAMAPMGQGLTDTDKQSIATYLTQAPSAPAATAAAGARRRFNPFAMGPIGDDKPCASNPSIKATSSDWSSVGFDASSTRFQSNPGLRANDVSRLKLKWSFATTGGMPTVVGDWLFITTYGKLYALDAKNGCVRWAASGVASRTTPVVIRSAISPSGWAAFVGDRGARSVRAFDAQTGKQIWRGDEVESNPVSGITGAPAIAGAQIFVPVTSGEEGAAMQPKYPCCSFRGSLVALETATGKKLWKTYVITEPLHPTHLNASGTQMQGPAGAAIWSAPTVDTKRGLVYVATGDSYTDAPTTGDDAIVAMDMKSGRIVWSNQVTTGDNFIMGCTDAVKAANCPDPGGPDFDFGASPILLTLASGKQILLAGQKSGVVYGIDPDTGHTLWRTRVGVGSALGGVEWGMATDKRRLFVANADIVGLIDDALKAQGLPEVAPATDPARPGLTALDPATGKVIWSVPAPVAPCKYAGDRSRDYARGACIRAQSAAPSVMPGVVFSGTLDGWFRAYDAATGKILWEYSTTAQIYDTVNGVKGQPGGGIDGLGPTIAGGMVYTMSGHNGASNTGGNGVNVLLAFSVDGK